MRPRPPAQRGAPRAPSRLWQAIEAIGAVAAVVTVTARSDRMFGAAGVLAAGAAVTAGYQARLRGQGRSSELCAVLAPALAGAFVLVCLLGLAAAHASTSRDHPAARPAQRPPATAQAQRRDAGAAFMWLIVSGMI
jgi:hypothetical protein